MGHLSSDKTHTADMGHMALDVLRPGYTGQAMRAALRVDGIGVPPMA